MICGVDEDQLDQIFKAMAHRERRHILASLQDRPGQSLFEICASGFVERRARQTISQHLDALERAGLLEIMWQGRTKLHAARLEPLRVAAEVAIGRFL